MPAAGFPLVSVVSLCSSLCSSSQTSADKAQKSLSSEVVSDVIHTLSHASHWSLSKKRFGYNSGSFPGWFGQKTGMLDISVGTTPKKSLNLKEYTKGHIKCN